MGEDDGDEPPKEHRAVAVTVQMEEKQASRSRSRLPARLRIGIAVLCGLLLLPGIARRTYLLTIRTIPVQAGPLEDIRTLRPIVVRNETILRSDDEGNFVPLVAEGRRVRAGEEVGLLVTADGQTLLRAPRPGIVRFHWDGWEEGLRGERLWQRTPGQWRSVRFEGGRTPERVEQGAAVARVVDSHSVWLYAEMPPRLDLRSGQTVTVSIPNATDERLQARVVERRVIQEGATTVMLLQLERYLPVLDAVRHIDVQLVLGRHDGVIVPADALVWATDGEGVYVREGTRVTFSPVQLSARVGDLVVIEGVEPGTKVVTNPWRVADW